MAARKTQYVPDHLRHTVAVKVRCSQELADRLARISKESGKTYAQIIEEALGPEKDPPKTC